MPSRLLGTYPQKQEGLFMQRIPLLAGRIGWNQCGAPSRNWPSDTRTLSPLHITTRQDIELHNLPEASVPKVYQELLSAGISTFGACGDSIRNITVNPACQFDPQDFDLLPLARLVKDYLQEWASRRHPAPQIQSQFLRLSGQPRLPLHQRPRFYLPAGRLISGRRRRIAGAPAADGNPPLRKIIRRADSASLQSGP